MIGKNIGNTPLLHLCGIEKHFSLSAHIFAKLERINPSGSVKDRAALFIIRAAMREGTLRGGKMVEATSGNMGISLAMLSAAYGISLTVVMPEGMSQERIKIMKAYGADVVITDKTGGMQGALTVAEKIAAEQEAYMPRQFVNTENVNAHYLTTGPEIYREMSAKVDIFVCGVGTGGTFSGVSRYLKEKCRSIKTVAAEPIESAVLSGCARGKHGIEGIGAGFVPPLFDISLCDEIITVSTEEARNMAGLVSRLEGAFVGWSSGAALCAAVALAKREENRGKNIVTIFPDGGERYLSQIFL